MWPDGHQQSHYINDSLTPPHSVYTQSQIPVSPAGEENNSLEFFVVEKVVKGPNAAFLPEGVRDQVWVVTVDKQAAWKQTVQHSLFPQRKNIYILYQMQHSFIWKLHKNYTILSEYNKTLLSAGHLPIDFTVLEIDFLIDGRPQCLFEPREEFPRRGV